MQERKSCLSRDYKLETRTNNSLSRKKTTRRIELCQAQTCCERIEDKDMDFVVVAQLVEVALLVLVAVIVTLALYSSSALLYDKRYFNHDHSTFIFKHCIN